MYDLWCVCGGGHVKNQNVTHLAEVPDVKEVKGVEQLTVPQPELVVAHLQEGPDVFQTQKL